jgi:hypothetical protein
MVNGVAPAIRALLQMLQAGKLGPRILVRAPAQHANGGTRVHLVRMLNPAK